MQVSPPQVERGSRAADHAGLVLGLLELGLCDLPGVVPRIGDTPVSPGLAAADTMNGPVWTLQIALAGSDPLGLEGQLCAPDAECVSLDAIGGTVADPSRAVAEVLRQVGDALDRRAPDDVQASWSRVGSKDPYAVLVAGRAASLVYGLRDAPPPEKLGDKAADPVARAFFLDPGMPLAGWMRGRTSTEATEVLAFRRASTGRPESLVLQADHAASILHPRLSQPLWADLARRAPADRRFVVPIAQNHLELGRPDLASAMLDDLGEGSGTIPSVAKLRVAIADATGATDDETLLQDWRESDPTDTEPVRRLVRKRVAGGRYADARELLPDLAYRGAADEADQLELALLNALGRPAEAAKIAERRGLADVAVALRAPAAEKAAPPASLPRLKADGGAGEDGRRGAVAR
ncbi:MAG: hypothetical protein H6737_06370 [Alphaproteobacteria bacterium]|nr:hypothetical protein [Alphaproteobacteria bacterium]